MENRGGERISHLAVDDAREPPQNAHPFPISIIPTVYETERRRGEELRLPSLSESGILNRNSPDMSLFISNKNGTSSTTNEVEFPSPSGDKQCKKNLVVEYPSGGVSFPTPSMSIQDDIHSQPFIYADGSNTFYPNNAQRLAHWGYQIDPRSSFSSSSSSTIPGGQYVTYMPVVWRPRYTPQAGGMPVGAPMYYGSSSNTLPQPYPPINTSETSFYYGQNHAYHQEAQQGMISPTAYYQHPVAMIPHPHYHPQVPRSVPPVPSVPSSQLPPLPPLARQAYHQHSSNAPFDAEGFLDALVEVAGNTSESKENLKPEQDQVNPILPVYNANGKYVCPQLGCGKVFPSKSRFQRHVLVHSGLKPFSCLYSSCSRKFSRRDNMLQHYRTHVVRVGPHQSGTTPSISIEEPELLTPIKTLEDRNFDEKEKGKHERNGKANKKDNDKYRNGTAAMNRKNLLKDVYVEELERERVEEEKEREKGKGKRRDHTKRLRVSSR